MVRSGCERRSCCFCGWAGLLLLLPLPLPLPAAKPPDHATFTSLRVEEFEAAEDLVDVRLASRGG